MQNILYDGHLDAGSIDAVSAAIIRETQALHADAKESLKVRLSAEEVLGIWAKELGEETACRVSEVRRFGKTVLLLKAEGKSVDPTQYRDDLLLSVTSNSNLTAVLGIPAEYRYTGGRNELRINLPLRRKSSVRDFLIAILAALFLGILFKLLLPGSTSVLSAQLVTPLMDTITDLLRLIAGPLVLCSVIAGIIGAGDAASFSRLGGTLVRRFLIMTFAAAAVIWLSVSWMFPISVTGGTDGGSSLSGLFQMLLDIIPGDIVTPFQTGNAMQIIFIAVCFGTASIFLSDTVPDLIRIMNQLNSIVQKIMAGISRLLPFYVFLCITNLILTSDKAALYGIAVPFLLVVLLDILLPLAYGCYASLKVGIPLKKLLTDQFPTYLLALTTASSAAAFHSNAECCRKKLHIDEKLVNIGVPFGQVLFKTGSLTTLIILALFMAKQYAVPMTPGWILTLLVMASILAVATPPIPGGGISATLVLFTQLGIPASCMAICATILTFTDYTVTACSIACLQQELLITARKTGMVQDDLRV